MLRNLKIALNQDYQKEAVIGLVPVGQSCTLTIATESTELRDVITAITNIDPDWTKAEWVDGFLVSASEIIVCDATRRKPSRMVFVPFESGQWPVHVAAVLMSGVLTATMMHEELQAKAKATEAAEAEAKAAEAAAAVAVDVDVDDDADYEDI